MDGCRGFTLIGLITFVVVSAIAIPPMMLCLTGWFDGANQSERMEIAVQLAVDLMEEILAKDFADLDGTDDETARADFDDVDDYNGWSSSPPKDARGTSLTAYGSYSRSVTVTSATQSDLTPLNPPPLGSTEYKVITVRIDWDDDYITIDALKVDFSDQFSY